MMYGFSKRPYEVAAQQHQQQHHVQPQRHERVPSAAERNTLADSYLFSPHFKPADDLLPLDAKQKHDFWMLHGCDIGMQQQLLAEARELQHSRFRGLMSLKKAVAGDVEGQESTKLTDVLATIQQVSFEYRLSTSVSHECVQGACPACAGTCHNAYVSCCCMTACNRS